MSELEAQIRLVAAWARTRVLALHRDDPERGGRAGDGRRTCIGKVHAHTLRRWRAFEAVFRSSRRSVKASRFLPARTSTSQPRRVSTWTAFCTVVRPKPLLAASLASACGSASSTSRALMVSAALPGSALRPVAPSAAAEMASATA